MEKKLAICFDSTDRWTGSIVGKSLMAVLMGFVVTLFGAAEGHH